MAANWRKKVAEARASGGGDYLGNGADGSGRVVILDLQMKDVYGEEFQFTANLLVKSSQPDPRYPDVKPEPVGAVRSYVAQLTNFESAAANMKGLLVAIDPDFSTADQGEFDAQLDKVLRIADKDDASKGWKAGRTIPNTVCPARGFEVAYKTRRKMTRGSAKTPPHEITVIDFTAVENTEESVKANLAFIDSVGK